MTDHAPVIVHSFETCTDPDCRDVLCEHYRAGLAAGHDFMKRTESGFARTRAAAGQAGTPELP
jgi:hypothetical protein